MIYLISPLAVGDFSFLQFSHLKTKVMPIYTSVNNGQECLLFYSLAKTGFCPIFLFLSFWGLQNSSSFSIQFKFLWFLVRVNILPHFYWLSWFIFVSLVYFPFRNSFFSSLACKNSLYNKDIFLLLVRNITNIFSPDLLYVFSPYLWFFAI